MQFVIDIPDNRDWIANNLGYIPDKLSHVIGTAILNGAVLPEYHGKLYDEKDLKAHMIRDNCDGGCRYLDERDLVNIKPVLE